MKKQLFALLLILSAWIAAAQAPTVFELARKGNLEAMRELVASDPKSVNATDQHGFSPLILATYRANNEVAKFLIEKGSDINYNSEMGNALMAAIVRGNNEMALYLIDKGTQLNATDAGQTTALMFAVQFKNPEIIKALLGKHADKTLTDSKGKTAFEYAAISADQQIINLLK